MKSNFYLTGNDPLHDKVITALYDGCPTKKELRSVQEYEPSEVAVVFGVYKKAVPFSKYRGQIIESQKKHGKTIVLETGYINRGDEDHHHYAMGLNGLNGRADFKNYNMPPDRWKKLGVELKPWKWDGKYILVCGQVPWDASVDHTVHLDWIDDVIRRTRWHTDRPILFRPHPKAPDHFIAGVERSKKSIEEDFEDAWAVVTFNSNSGVEAAIAGVPVFIEDCGSMAFPIANRNLVYLNDPRRPDRQKWANELAYCQWTLDEMRSGEAWRHLLR